MKAIRHISVIALALAAAMLLPAANALATEQARASGESRAGLVVQFGDGSAQTFCVAFPGDSISGVDLLLKSGLDVQVEAYGTMGALVCKIGADGCDYPAQPCACKSFEAGGPYWSYHHLKDGTWVSSAVGASSYKVRNGDVDAWAWTGGKPPSAVSSFARLCGTAAPPPLPSATPARRRVAPSSTPVPTAEPTQAMTPTTTPKQQVAAAPSHQVAVPTVTPTLTPTMAPTPTLEPTPPPTPAAGKSAAQGSVPVPAIAVTVGILGALAFVVLRRFSAGEGPRDVE